jgi:transcriptional regulator with XRE-family HTH domain
MATNILLVDDDRDTCGDDDQREAFGRSMAVLCEIGNTHFSCASGNGKDVRPLHRLAEVRKQQSMSLQTLAGRLRLDVAAVAEQERETSDLPLSTVYAWRTALGVPVTELLIDHYAPLSTPRFEGWRIKKLMTTAARILAKAQTNSLRRTATMLIEQLVEIMPELNEGVAQNTKRQPP